jgi:hypothetical protein
MTACQEEARQAGCSTSPLVKTFHTGIGVELQPVETRVLHLVEQGVLPCPKTLQLWAVSAAVW